jgi:two-component system NtrC family response regulator
MVKKGTFRQDLLFRLRTLVIELPPLREMKEDIKDLALHYTVRLSKRYGADTKGFSPEFWDVLYKYHWPGNIRELIQALEKAIASAKHEPTLFPKHLPKHIRVQVVRSLVSKESEREKAETESIDQKEGLPKLQDTRASAIAEVERRYLTELMSITGGKIKAATRISGLSRSRLYTLLKKYDISPSR